MNGLTYLAAAGMLAAPMLLMNAPAEARTARQEALQGQGLYTTSKGLPYGYRGSGYYGRPRGYGYGAYGYRGGYGYRGYPRHRRYYDGY